jgi:hypothetical protein
MDGYRSHPHQLHFDFVALENSLKALPSELTSLASFATIPARAPVVLAEESSLAVVSIAFTDFSIAVVCVGNSLLAELTTAFALESTFCRSASIPLTPDARLMLPSDRTDFSSSLTCVQKAGLEEPQPPNNSKPMTPAGSAASKHLRR